MRNRRLTPWTPVMRATTRQWLYMKYTPLSTRAELKKQAMVWVGMLLMLLVGLVGLAAPLA